MSPQHPDILIDRAYIGGQWRDSERRFKVTDPATGETLAEVPDLGAADARDAIAAADDDIVLEHDYKRSTQNPGSFSEDVVDEIDELIALRSDAKKNKNYKLSGRLDNFT